MGGQCQESSYRGVREFYAQGRKSGVRRQPPCQDDVTPGLHPLSSLSILSSRLPPGTALLGERRGTWTTPSQGSALRAQPGTCRAEEATALRAPGRWHETGRGETLERALWLGAQ